MYYRYGGSFIGTMTETNRYVRAYREGKVPFVVNQSIWFEGEAKFADIILPACTNYERWDIGEWACPTGAGASAADACNHRLIVLQKKCIEPLGESKSDYDIFAALAGKLGLGDVYTEGGHTELDWVKRLFDASDLPSRISWEEFEKKGYYMVPVPEDRKRTPALRWFAEDRKRDTPDLGPKPWDTVGLKGLQTASGKIEFVASSLKRFYAGGVDDPERPVMGPQYIPSWEGHRTTDLVDKYPLQLVSPHPRFSLHTMSDGKDSWSERDQGPPGAGRRPRRSRRPLLLDPPAQQQGRRRPGHRRRRSHQGLQRPRRGDPRRPGDRAGGSRHGALLRIGRRLHPVGRAGLLARHGGMHQHPHSQAVRHPHVDGHGAQLLPDRGGEMGLQFIQTASQLNTQATTERNNHVNPIITASLTGPAALKKDTPAMPGSPEEIAEAAKGAYEAGAAVLHIHLRDNDQFTADLDIAKKTVELCREACPGIVQLSTGGGFAYEERMKIVEAMPAMATLNPATMTMGDHEFRNPPKQMLELAERMLELGVKPEVEIYDTGHVALMLDLLKRGLLTEPLQVSFVMGTKGGMAADPDAARLLRARAAREHQLAGHRHLQGQPAADHHRSGHGRQRACGPRGHHLHPAEGTGHLQRPARRAARGCGEVHAAARRPPRTRSWSG